MSNPDLLATVYGALFALIIHGCVRCVEGPHLRRTFGTACADFCAAVARNWGRMQSTLKGDGSPQVDLTTLLKAPAEQVIDAVQQPELLRFVARGWLRFQPQDPQQWPPRWQPGSYRVRLYWRGWLPLGWQVIRIERLPDEGATWRLRDNGYGWAIRRWDHEIRVTPQGNHCLYSDRVTIDAGWRTSLVVWFAQRFYAHRQQRWRELVASDCF